MQEKIPDQPSQGNAAVQTKQQESSRYESKEKKKGVIQSKQGKLPTIEAKQRPVQRKSNNTGLPDNLKAGIENLSGYSMDDVKVHYNSDKPVQLKAHAYAQGTDIHLGAGQEKHLPHEAWHVVQQKQGRVQPTTQLKSKGISINDDAGLEREADAMGAKAMQMKEQPTTTMLIQASIRNGTAAIQGKWILRDGNPVEVNDDYVLQQGETDFNMSLYFQQPRVIFDKGNKVGKYDKKGNLSFEDFDSSKLPTHNELQKTRKTQGGNLGKRLLSDKNIKAEADKIEKLADALEQLAGSNVPKNHASKISKLAKKSFTGSQFRGVIKSQDEFTQSEATTAFFDGLRSHLSNTTDPDAKRFMEQALRAFSSLRARTGSISAPMTHKGGLVGQQHPTSFTKHEKLPNGGSGHTYADRQRVHLQNQAFSDLSQSSDVSASTLIVSNLLAALVATLSTMASPHTASNVPDFDKSFDKEQLKDRKQAKKQAQEVSSKFGFGTSKRKKQKLSKPFRAYDRPSSPLREEDASSDEEIIEPKVTKKLKVQQSNGGSSKNTLLFGSSAQSQVKLPSMEQFLRGLKIKKQKADLLQLINRIELGLTLPNNKITTLALARLRQILGYVQSIQVDALLGAYFLTHYYGQIDALYQQAAPYIYRRVANGNHQDMDGYANVTRVGALEQFMAECGQMATHNVIALQNAQNNGNFNNVNQGIQDQNALAGIGNFDNNVGEGEIRNLLTQAGHQGIPVIGNLTQLQTFIRDYNATEQLGNALLGQQGMGQYLIQQLWPVGNVEVQEIMTMNNFIQGNTNEINFIINTEGHQIISQGYHWITVRLERANNGAIRLFFLDSLRGNNDYTALFTGLHRFINGQAPANGGSDNSKKRSFDNMMGK